MAQVGRPVGYPKTGGRQKQTLNNISMSGRVIASQYCTEAIDTLVSIMRASNDEVGVMARIASCKEILDRGIGKPIQAVELGNKDGEPLRVSVQDARDQLREILENVIDASANENAEHAVERENDAASGGNDPQRLGIPRAS